MTRLAENRARLPGRARAPRAPPRTAPKALWADDALFARRWRAYAAAQRFDALNALIETHNEWYPSSATCRWTRGPASTTRQRPLLRAAAPRRTLDPERFPGLVERDGLEQPARSTERAGREGEAQEAVRAPRSNAGRTAAGASPRRRSSWRWTASKLGRARTRQRRPSPAAAARARSARPSARPPNAPSWPATPRRSVRAPGSKIQPAQATAQASSGITSRRGRLDRPAEQHVRTSRNQPPRPTPGGPRRRPRAGSARRAARRAAARCAISSAPRTDSSITLSRRCT